MVIFVFVNAFYLHPACLKGVLTLQPILIVAVKNTMYKKKAGHLDQLSELFLIVC